MKNRLYRSLITFIGVMGLVLFVSLFVVLVYFERKALAYDLDAVAATAGESVILDATETPIGYLRSGPEGSDLPMNQISRHFINAVIAREDTRFYKHHGVDHLGLLRANIRNVKERRVIQGASTITMQLSRMTFELRDRSFQRKMVEMAIARRIERRFSKDEILRMYLNRIYLGTEAHGVAQAADAYFGKHPSELTLAESAMLAGIIRAPNRFSPFRHPDRAYKEMVTTLQRMGVEGMITRQQAEQAKKNKPKILPQKRWIDIRAKRLQIFKRDWIINMVEAKLDKLLPANSKQSTALTIKTTVDHRLQESVVNNLHKWLSGVERARGYAHPVFPKVNDKGEPQYLQGAGVLIDNQNGAIRALVGGRNYAHSGYNRAIYANRQAGSIIKPLVYATGFETGLFPGTYVSDERIQPNEINWWQGEEWDPLNSDGVHDGLRPAKEGLIKSRNTMTVRVAESAGHSNVFSMLGHAGLKYDDEENPQVYIGNKPVSLLSITSAYTAFPMRGERFEPYLIESISSPSGKVLYQHPFRKYRVFSAEGAWLTTSILQKVLEEGGSGARLRQWGFRSPAGGKTGTTNDFVDAWFVGFTSRLTGGFWVGLDKPVPVLAGAYGGAVAMPVWKDSMQAAAKIGYEFTDFPKPGEIFPVRLCRHTGLLASPSCESEGCAYTEKIPSSMIPREFCRRELK